MCRFYGFELDKVMAMTLRRFAIMLNEIGNVLELELGGDSDSGQKETSLTGDAGFALAKTIFPRGRK